MVTFTVNPSAHSVKMSPTDENVGGGTWSHGTGTDGIYKGCYSNYIHPSKRHSASVSIGNATDKSYADAGDWANAYARSGWAFTCNAYWATY
ncbi:lactococcin 972 family bacteriocin [Streptomyces gamaensis]|uniref:Lactococcin 972 family bacteriocin n=1 Tax=Streptomyces gamaensis TaxID=1763542 RepID=A0ABW0Z321_9ACTN